MTLKLSEKQLLELGFEKINDGGEVYFQYVFDKNDYINSKFLATEDVNPDDIKDDENYPQYLVINPINTEGEDYIEVNQIKEFISAGGFK